MTSSEQLGSDSGSGKTIWPDEKMGPSEQLGSGEPPKCPTCGSERWDIRLCPLCEINPNHASQLHEDHPNCDNHDWHRPAAEQSEVNGPSCHVCVDVFMVLKGDGYICPKCGAEAPTNTKPAETQGGVGQPASPETAAQPPDPEMLGTCDQDSKLHSPEVGCVNYKPSAEAAQPMSERAVQRYLRNA